MGSLMFKSTKPRQRLGALLIAGAAAGSAVGLAAATASPALADDDGNTFCFLSTGKMSAAVTGSSSPHPIEIQWSSNVPACRRRIGSR